MEPLSEELALHRLHIVGHCGHNRVNKSGPVSYLLILENAGHDPIFLLYVALLDLGNVSEGLLDLARQVLDVDELVVPKSHLNHKKRS